jgi:hypothetical protein
MFASHRKAREAGEWLLAFWANRAYQIGISYERITVRNNSVLYCLRSDLVDGLPKGWRGGGQGRPNGGVDA